MVTQSEDGAKDRGDRTNSKFVYNLNPLLLDSESETTKRVGCVERGGICGLTLVRLKDLAYQHMTHVKNSEDKSDEV